MFTPRVWLSKNNVRKFVNIIIVHCMVKTETSGMPVKSVYVTMCLANVLYIFFY